MQQAVDPTVHRSRGRPSREVELTADQLHWIKAPLTLAQQVSFTLKARRLQFNEQFGLDLTLTEFRGLYHGLGLSRQMLRTRMGRKKL